MSLNMIPSDKLMSTSKDQPSSKGFVMPAEWEKHEAVWLAWPSHEDLWQENLNAAQDEFVELCKNICDHSQGEHLNILIPFESARIQAQEKLSKHLKASDFSFHNIPFGDIWLRDTSCIFLKNKDSQKASISFGFNGWGEKYQLDHDDKVSSQIAKVSHEKFKTISYQSDWVLEGGSIEVDGQGLCLTSRQCLLNKNRNPNLNESQIEEKLKRDFGFKKILWLEDGLLNDHTDGHIDNMARFIGPSHVLCMRTQNQSDPNYSILEKIYSDLKSMTDIQANPLKVDWLESPGEVYNEDGDLIPASYMNFYISNTKVIMPSYQKPNEKKVLQKLASFFKGRECVALSAKAILSGGGAFHCISQQVPL